jgi:AraC-like DNA-binding protein
LNDSGEKGTSRIVRHGAIHLSHGQSTSIHAHYAWKIHIGLDAPVWLQSEHAGDCNAILGNQVLIVPPGISHATGALGWSVALFVSPGAYQSPWRASSGPHVISGKAASLVIDAARQINGIALSSSPDYLAEICKLTFSNPGAQKGIDRRVESALRTIAGAPDLTLRDLASVCRLSPDRLSHLIKEETDTTLRRHVLWARVVRLLSQGMTRPNLSHAAAQAGFSDHAHMTRTFRQCLGRAPSEFEKAPDVIEAWFSE